MNAGLVFRGFLVAAVLSAGARAGDPTAQNPLPPPAFSVDLSSPVLGTGVRAADVLSAPGPNVVFAAANLLLPNPLDELDALSGPNWTIDPADTFVIIFSVDRDSAGALPPDPLLVSLSRPFNVQNQAANNQAAGDAFMSLLLFDRNGTIPPGPQPIAPNNTLVINQGDAGGVDFALGPDISPAAPHPPGSPLDGLDAGMGSGGPPPPGAPGPVFFSASSASPSLPGLPGTTSGADVYVDFNPTAPGGENLYAPPIALGLVGGDEIDGLIVFDNGDLLFMPNLDQIIFSLAPGSPSLGPNSPADLFTTTKDGGFTLYAAALDLGLLESDNVDMVDFALCDDVLTCALDWAIGYIKPNQPRPHGPGQPNTPNSASKVGPP